MKVVHSWLREFATVPDDVAGTARRLAGCGFEVADIEGEVIDVEVTANRPDCLNVYGLAREAAVAFDVPLAPPPGTMPDAMDPTGPVPVTIDDLGCGRYTLALADVTIGPSPDWLATRLTAAGVRPINNLVDVTNYVMLEMGHPMHAFDASRLTGPEIRVRRARPGERLTTLDGHDRQLDETMLVIADRDQAVAIAGVMGGLASEVSATTTRVAFEAAWFLPATVRLTGRRLNLKTEASARFERGADIGAPPRAIARALELLAQAKAGTATGPIVDVYPRPATPRVIELRRDRLARLLGDAVPDADVVRLLSGLGFAVTAGDAGWSVTAPSARVDVSREADLIEEVGRHWGYDRLPVTFPVLRAMPPRPTPAVERSRRVRRVLSGAGLQEAQTFTFIDRQAAAPFVADVKAIVPIANPLSEKFAVLRPSLLPGLVDALIYNCRREMSDVRFFETGTVFGPDGELSSVAWVLTGNRSDHWSDHAGPLDFFDASGVAHLLAVVLASTLTPEAADDLPGLVPGQAARLVDETGQVRGRVGRIVPGILSDRGLDAAIAVYGGEVDLPASASATQGTIAAIPRYPSVVRDLSILIDERLPAAEVRGTIRANAPGTLVAVREFDRYRGKGVPEGLVSLSWRLTFRAADRTLTDLEVQEAVDAVVAALARAHTARIRGADGNPPTE